MLTPLINQNQTVTVNSTMNATIGDTCNWEIKVNTSNFMALHPTANLSSVFFNISFGPLINMTTYVLQGLNIKNATNATVSPMSN